MIKRHWKIWAASGTLMVALSVVLFATQAEKHAQPSKGPSTEQRIIHYVRERFGVPPSTKLTLGPFQDSEYRDFYQTTIYIDNGKEKNSQRAFITKDRRYMILGNVYSLDADPRKEVERSIKLKGQPSVGPASAPVTIVEYADLECPICARTQQFFKDDLIPKYGNKIRIVFKEFPLVGIHAWALTGAIANECVYTMNPSDYFRYRSIIYQNQTAINGANARTLLLDFGQRIGLDRFHLATCIDSKATLPRVQASMREGQELGIASTPTIYINGAPVVGLSPTEIYKHIDASLRAAR